MKNSKSKVILWHFLRKANYHTKITPALLNNFIDKEQLRGIAEPLCKSGYGKYLMEIIEMDEIIHLLFLQVFLSVSNSNPSGHPQDDPSPSFLHSWLQPPFVSFSHAWY